MDPLFDGINTGNIGAVLKITIRLPGRKPLTPQNLSVIEKNHNRIGFCCGFFY
jgi:hypothetical protein